MNNLFQSNWSSVLKDKWANKSSIDNLITYISKSQYIIILSMKTLQISYYIRYNISILLNYYIIHAYIIFWFNNHLPYLSHLVTYLDFIFRVTISVTPYWYYTALFKIFYIHFEISKKFYHFLYAYIFETNKLFLDLYTKFV